ncbi:MAG: Crp/Fnr family transcriptional regulator [Acidobacteria bacterium]|nr:Crp/Fnr family transcriptional regulator [Acidobacteriota bacterium]
MNFVDYIKTFFPLSDAVAEELLGKSRKHSFQRHHLLHREGEVCDRLWFVERGLVRWFYHDEEGRDITDSFAAEHSFVTAFDSFFQRKPSRYFIEVLEDSEIYSMRYSDLDESFKKFPEIERVSRLVLLEILEQQLEKNTALQFRTAEQRYRFIIEKHPDLLQRVSLGNIASYLGITQETLSRIRSKKPKPN